MPVFIVGLVLLVISIVSFVFWRKLRKTHKSMVAENIASPASTDERGGRYSDAPNSDRELRETAGAATALLVAFGVSLFGGLLTIGMDSYTVIPSRNEGIPVTFGQVGNPLDSGPHIVAPWTDVTKVDATTQNINRNTDEDQWANHQNCTAVLVRLASGASACTDITAQWNVTNNGTAASNLWTQYRGNTDDADKTNDNFITNLTNNVVDREIQRAMNTAFATYNPIVVGNDNQIVNTPLDLKAYSATVLADLKASIPGGIDTTEFLISHVHFDKATQDKINQLAQAKADTQIALQKKQTAQAQKDANDLLASNSSNDPGVMFQNCLNVLKDLAASGQLANLPINSLQCVTGSNGAPVIVSTK
jgi:hypothetical protein